MIIIIATQSEHHHYNCFQQIKKEVDLRKVTLIVDAQLSKRREDTLANYIGKYQRIPVHRSTKQDNFTYDIAFVDNNFKDKIECLKKIILE
jgi:hypothetical protein